MAEQNTLVHAFTCHLIAAQAEHVGPEIVRLYDVRHKQFLTFLKDEGYAPPFELECLNRDNVDHAAAWIADRSRGCWGEAGAADSLVSTLELVSAWMSQEGFGVDRLSCASVA